jgi:hypothetical protein
MKLSELRLTAKALPRTALDSVVWKDFPLKPAVNFTLAYGDDAFYIKFRARRLSTRPLQVSPDRKSCYNIEFNCIAA